MFRHAVAIPDHEKDPAAIGREPLVPTTTASRRRTTLTGLDTVVSQASCTSNCLAQLTKLVPRSSNTAVMLCYLINQMLTHLGMFFKKKRNQGLWFASVVWCSFTNLVPVQLHVLKNGKTSVMSRSFTHLVLAQLNVFRIRKTLLLFPCRPCSDRAKA